MEKIYKLNAYGKTHNIALRKGTYSSNGTLAIAMVEISRNGSEEPWSTLTVNISESNFFADGDEVAFVDTNNNGDEILDWLEKNDIAHFVGVKGYSGWCEYPLVQFTKTALSQMSQW